MSASSGSAPAPHGGPSFERFFYSEHGSSRSYLFSKVFLLMLALDTWMLMIGHAGRYGMAGFNVAHFAWLDAIEPAPTAASYVAVLVLTGLLALVLVLTGIRRVPALVLFLLYTYSWSMSMLDSYQHHYFVSLVLFCLVFFPETSALEIHPLPKPAPAPGKQKRKQQAERGRKTRYTLRGFAYAASVLLAKVVYRSIEAPEHRWLALFAFAGAVALITAWFTPEQPRAPLLRPGLGFSLLGASVAILYTYTAIAKMDAAWLAGHTLRSISSVEQVFAGVADYAERLGMPRDKVWSTLATLVIPQELTLGVLYLLAVHRDRLDKRWLHVLCTLGFGLAVVLHVGAEAMGLQIGWFSYYMLALACCFLLPLAVVDRLAIVFTWPARWLQQQALDWQAQAPPTAAASLGLAFGCSALLMLIGKLLDLPGALGGCALASAALFAVTLGTLKKGSNNERSASERSISDPRQYAVATAIAGFGMWLAIAASPVRFDFYRYLGGDLSRRGEPEAALEAYVRGERYAPAGASRKKQIDELRRKLAK